MVRFAGCALAAVAAFLLLLVPVPVSAQTSHVWVQNAWTVHKLNQSYPATAAYFFNTPGSYGTGSSTAGSPVLDGFATTPVLRYTSYAQFVADTSTGVIPSTAWPAGSWVEYDNEEWAATPVAEQQDPELYMRLFGQLAHDYGLKALMTPARDLGNTDTACPKQPGWGNNGWYVNCQIAGIAAGAGDGVVVQDQANTLDVATYSSVFAQAQAQEQAANPAAFVDAELSDGYGTPAQAFAAGSSVPGASGFFINCANSDVSWENSLLSQFQAAGY